LNYREEDELYVIFVIIYTFDYHYFIAFAAWS